MLKKLLILFIIFFLLGCQQKHFSRVYDKSSQGLKIDSLKLIHENSKIKDISFNLLKKHGFHISSQSSYILKTDYAIYPKTCNNPLASAEQKSYIGFVKFTLYNGKNRLYMCQSDFKKKSDIEDKLDGLIDIMIDEMKLSLN